MNMVYIAAKFSRRVELRNVAQQLLPLNVAVISRWIWEDEADFAKLTPRDAAKLAQRDINDIEDATTLIIDTTEELSQGAGGGRELELGFAMRLKTKTTIRIGPARNPFHYMVDQAFYTWNEYIAALKKN